MDESLRLVASRRRDIDGDESKARFEGATGGCDGLPGGAEGLMEQ